mgnify:CR=1 FL=1
MKFNTVPKTSCTRPCHTRHTQSERRLAILLWLCYQPHMFACASATVLLVLGREAYASMSLSSVKKSSSSSSSPLLLLLPSPLAL